MTTSKKIESKNYLWNKLYKDYIIKNKCHIDIA